MEPAGGSLRQRTMTKPTVAQTRLRALRALAVLLLISVAAACSAAGSPSPDSSGSPGAGSPSALPSGPLTQPQLKVRLMQRLGPLWYCDPDAYPVSRDDEAARALERWPEVVADAGALSAILEHLEIAPGAVLTDAQKLLAYREWKVLAAILLQPGADGTFRFDYLAQPPGGAASGGQGSHVTGTIDSRGTIDVDRSEPAGAPNCPICLPGGALVETPAGPVAVDRLRTGQAVWTLDAAGRRVAGIIVRLGSVPVPADHEMVKLVLADGRTVTASPGHPLADGRRLGAIQPGDVVAGSVVRSAGRVPYDAGRTFDLLVSGATGSYEIGGIWLGSTLAP